MSAPWVSSDYDSDLEAKTQEKTERGATLVEYALVVALVVGVTIFAIDDLTSNSGTYLSNTGGDIGEPRERIANIDPDLPDPPAWLP